MSKFRLTGLMACLPVAFLGVLQVAQTPVPPPVASGQLPYADVNSTNAAWVLTEGRFTTLPTNLFTLGSQTGVRARSAEGVFWGVGTAGQTYEYRIYAVKRSIWALNGAVNDYELQLFCSGVATLGSSAGVSTRGAKSTDLIVSGLTCIPAPYAASAIDAYGGMLPFAYSPGGSGQAKLFLPDLCNSSDLVLETRLVTATSTGTYFEKGT